MTNVVPEDNGVTDLIPEARNLAGQLGQMPTQTRLMRHFRIGRRKASNILEHLTEFGPDPGDSIPVDPEENPPARPISSWPLILLAIPAFIAIWSGWVGLGGLTGFGVIHPLPGIWDNLQLNTAITLPVGVETYAAYALRVWLSPNVPVTARSFAKWSAIGSLVLGAAGQVAYHLMVAAEIDRAPWMITTLVSCLPVAVLGMGAALVHLLRDTR